MSRCLYLYLRVYTALHCVMVPKVRYTSTRYQVALIVQAKKFSRSMVSNLAKWLSPGELIIYTIDRKIWNFQAIECSKLYNTHYGFVSFMSVYWWKWISREISTSTEYIQLSTWCDFLELWLYISLAVKLDIFMQ